MIKILRLRFEEKFVSRDIFDEISFLLYSKGRKNFKSRAVYKFTVIFSRGRGASHRVVKYFPIHSRVNSHASRGPGAPSRAQFSPLNSTL